MKAADAARLSQENATRLRAAHSKQQHDYLRAEISRAVTRGERIVVVTEALDDDVAATFREDGYTVTDVSSSHYIQFNIAW